MSRPLFTVALATSVLLGSCRAPEPEPFLADVRAEAGTVRWPRAPREARVVYLGEIGSSEAFEVRRSFWHRFVEWIRDEAANRLLRPAAVAVQGSRLAVADPGLRAAHVLDLSTRTWTTVGKGSDDVLVSPVDVAFLPDGRLLVSDSATETLWAYSADGRDRAPFTTTRLERPTGIAVDPQAARVWVNETLGHRLRVFDLTGRELARLGERGTDVGQFNYPVHIASDRNGGVWVTDSLNFRIQHFGSEGPVDRLFGEVGHRAGAFARPRGLTVDDRGRVLIVDALFDAVQIFDPDGTLLLVFGGRGTGPGEFWLPSDVALDESDRIYVADSYNQRVQVFAYRPPDKEGP